MDTAKQKRIDGLICGLLGVVIFSGSLPATRVAVADLSPLFLTGARAVIAAAVYALARMAFSPDLPPAILLPADTTIVIH